MLVLLVRIVCGCKCWAWHCLHSVVTWGKIQQHTPIQGVHNIHQNYTHIDNVMNFNVLAGICCYIGGGGYYESFP